MKIFLDTEFIEDGTTTDLLSIGMVREDGVEAYWQLPRAHFKNASDWVARNVFPHLDHFDMGKQSRSCEATHGNGRCEASCPWVERVWLKDEIRDFCGEAPEFWGYFCAYDWVALCRLYGDLGGKPLSWPYLAYDLRQELDHGGFPLVHQPEEDPHHALKDARWIRDNYLAYAAIAKVRV